MAGLHRPDVPSSVQTSGRKTDAQVESPVSIQLAANQTDVTIKSNPARTRVARVAVACRALEVTLAMPSGFHVVQELASRCEGLLLPQTSVLR